MEVASAAISASSAAPSTTGGGGNTAAPSDAVLSEVGVIIEKLLAVRGTRQSSNMQVGRDLLREGGHKNLGRTWLERGTRRVSSFFQTS